MKPYPKIQTIFKRDPDNNYKTLLQGEFSKPEFEYLSDNKWIFREKLHGTNIRVIYNPEKNPVVRVRGRREKSQVPDFLEEEILKQFIWKSDLFEDTFGDTPVCLYGEGVGEKIQNVGENYVTSGNKFVLFDVRIGDWWLKEEDVLGIAQSLKIDIAPRIGVGTLWDALDLTQRGFYSTLAKNVGNDLIAEGLICVPISPMYTRRGKRVITKIKHQDFTNG